MNKILQKMYEEYVVYSEDSYEANRKLESKVENLISLYTMKLTGKEKETLEDVFFDVCDKSKYVGFTLGMKCCFKLILELLSD